MSIERGRYRTWTLFKLIHSGHAADPLIHCAGELNGHDVACIVKTISYDSIYYFLLLLPRILLSNPPRNICIDWYFLLRLLGVHPVKALRVMGPPSDWAGWIMMMMLKAVRRMEMIDRQPSGSYTRRRTKQHNHRESEMDGWMERVDH